MVEIQVRQIKAHSETVHKVILQDKKSGSCLSIMIGPVEASAISAACNGEEPVRPHSYDLAFSLLNEASGRIDRVAITDLRDGIYYAEIHLTNSAGVKKIIDSRPSDAIALAIRAEAPIFAAQELICVDAVEPTMPEISAVKDTRFDDNILQKDLHTDRTVPNNETVINCTNHKSGDNKAVKDLSGSTMVPCDSIDNGRNLSTLEILKRRLRHAVSEEAFEEAARLRDSIADIQDSET